MAGKADRRVQRTQQLLREALFSLIREKGFEALTVQDILDRANVGRATFYTHFDNKEDLLVSGFDELRASLKQRQREALSRGSDVEEHLFAFSREMLAHVQEHRDLFQVMIGKRSGAVVQSLVHKLLVDIVRDEVKTTSAASRADPARTEAVVQFIAGGFFGMLMWWLGAKVRLPVDEMDARFRQLAITALRAAR